jgi:hypothetical protein
MHVHTFKLCIHNQVIVFSLYKIAHILFLLEIIDMLLSLFFGVNES